MLDFDLTMALAFAGGTDGGLFNESMSLPFALGVGVGVGLVVLCCLYIFDLLLLRLMEFGFGVGVGCGPALAAPTIPARAIAVIANVFSSVFLILIFESREE
jgi:hypothetical protein